MLDQTVVTGVCGPCPASCASPRTPSELLLPLPTAMVWDVAQAVAQSLLCPSLAQTITLPSCVDKCLLNEGMCDVLL